MAKRGQSPAGRRAIAAIATIAAIAAIVAISSSTVSACARSPGRVAISSSTVSARGTGRGGLASSFTRVLHTGRGGFLLAMERTSSRRRGGRVAVERSTGCNGLLLDQQPGEQLHTLRDHLERRRQRADAAALAAGAALAATLADWRRCREHLIDRAQGSARPFFERTLTRQSSQHSLDRLDEGHGKARGQPLNAGIGAANLANLATAPAAAAAPGVLSHQGRATLREARVPIGCSRAAPVQRVDELEHLA